jgi:hypothetical protein
MTDTKDVSPNAVRVEFGAYCHPFTNPIVSVEGGVMVEWRLALEVIRLRAEVATLTRERDEAREDAARWRFYCCPQTALVLGSNCDPNDDSIDWREEINRLADARSAALTQGDA